MRTEVCILADMALQLDYRYIATYIKPASCMA